MSNNDVLLATTIHDWRIGEGCDEGENLSDNQKKDWPVIISRGGYNGLSLQFIAPDGTRRSLEIEIDSGNVKIAAYRGDDDCDSIITIQEDGIHCTSGYIDADGIHRAVLANENGLTQTKEEPTPSFVA